MLHALSRTRITIGSALLYAAALCVTSPAVADPLSPALQAELSGMREGSLRKLVFQVEPTDRTGIAFLTKAGQSMTLAQSNGKIRVVNFWATWCAPCREEKPSLDALQASLGGADFEVIAIATGRNSPKAIEKFNKQVGIENLATYTDAKSAAAREMAVLGLPVSVILDRDGNEIARLTGGAEWASDSARAILDRLIEVSSGS